MKLGSHVRMGFMSRVQSCFQVERSESVVLGTDEIC